MKLYKYFLLGGCLAGALTLGSCATEDLAEYNTDPSVVAKPDMRFLFTQGLSEFDPSGYWSWFYDFSAMCKYGQVTGGSNGFSLNMPSISSGGGDMARPLKILRDMDYHISLMDAGEAAKYTQIRSMLQTLVVYMGIQDTDFYGDQPYSEAYRARYGGTLTPKYDTQKELFEQFYAELCVAADALANGVTLNGVEVPQVSLGNQDFVWKGNAAKWAKFANSLKLKLAVRLLHVDKEWAKEIAQEAYSHNAGFMTEVADNFIYNKGPENYGVKEDPSPGYANMKLVDFMVDNLDPRVRFFFQKNDFNSEVVQAYFDNDKELPSYIAEKVNYAEVDGKKVFESWKAPGEPWVRYVGLPVEIDASLNSAWNEYFDPQEQWLKLVANGAEKTYTPASYMNMEMYEGNRVYTYPTKPGAPVVQDKEPKSYYGMYMSAGEVNLYLAELSQLGLIGGNAADYFAAGVRASVQEWNNIAELNQIPYTTAKYDANEELIVLKSGEIEALLEKDAYKLTGGADDLEKIYLQMHLAFIYEPLEMYVTMRRSGVPMKNSAIFPYEEFNADGSAYPIPRRATFSTPSASDQMFDIIMKSYETQGFSIGNDANDLENQRLWYDKGAPAWGAGPSI